MLVFFKAIFYVCSYRDVFHYPFLQFFCQVGFESPVAFSRKGEGEGKEEGREEGRRVRGIYSLSLTPSLALQITEDFLMSKSIQKIQTVI